MSLFCFRALAATAVLLSYGAVHAEWGGRYPAVENTLKNVGHQLYLEAYNLPTFSASPTDPAPSPDGQSVAFAAKGWIWVMVINTRSARRVTRGGDVDSRPAWSPDGEWIAFIRDTTRDTSIVLLNLDTGTEELLVDSPALDIDPVFAPDGKSVFYSSAEAGDFDVWQVDLSSRKKSRITSDDAQELNPQPVLDGTAIAFVSRQGYFSDAVATITLETGEGHTLRTVGMAPQLRLAASPDGQSIVVVEPDQDKVKLVALDAKGGDVIQVARDASYPLSPAWASDGSLWLVQPTPDEQFTLFRTLATGGELEDMTPLNWEMGERTARVTLHTRQDGELTPARLAVWDDQGHPVAPETGISYRDIRQGRIFFYTPGSVTVDVPAGTLELAATHGLDGVIQLQRTVKPGEQVTLEVDLPESGFDAASRGWYSADFHHHMNYGGPYQLEPDDLVWQMRGEGLDVATPLLANLQTRYVDTQWWGWERTHPPLIRFSQEVRAHALGHIGVVGADALFDPWFFGPSYPVFAQADVINADVLQFTRAHGGLNSYVHPVVSRTPFPATGEPEGIVRELVPDAVMGDLDTIELACLWSEELGTSDLWYRLLNIGLRIMPSAGSDTMQNIHRMMAIGSTRIYARPDGPLTIPNFLDAVRQGRSFVTTGPMIEFDAGGEGPGGVITGDAGTVDWSLELHTPTAVEQVEILVNGQVVWSGKGPSKPGSQHYEGQIEAPGGGWIAARAHGGPSTWPIQDAYPFAHSAPVWFGSAGSVEPAAAQAAAEDLLRWMAIAEKQVNERYPKGTGERLKQRFAEARERLQSISDAHAH